MEHHKPSYTKYAGTTSSLTSRPLPGPVPHSQRPTQGTTPFTSLLPGVFIQPLDFSISIHLNSTHLISHISKTELPEGCSQVSSTQPISQGHLCLLHLQVSASGAKNSSFQPLSKSASRAKSHRPSFGCHQRISTPELPQWPILLFMAPRTRRFVPRPRRLPKIGQI